MPRHGTGRRPRRDPRATATVFRVVFWAFKDGWRRIAIRSDQTLDDLHAAIFSAFDRFDEHLYSFHLVPPGETPVPGRPIGDTDYTSPVTLEDAHPREGMTVVDASQVAIGSLGLTAGRHLLYQFDFGDNLWHVLTVEAIGRPLRPYARYPLLLEKVGESPFQYPPPDEEAESPTKAATERRAALRLGERERELIVKHTLAPPELTDRLRLAMAGESHAAFKYSWEEVDELLGYVAAESNHAKSRKIQTELDRLAGVLEEILAKGPADGA